MRGAQEMRTLGHQCTMRRTSARSRPADRPRTPGRARPGGAAGTRPISGRRSRRPAVHGTPARRSCRARWTAAAPAGCCARSALPIRVLPTASTARRRRDTARSCSLSRSGSGRPVRRRTPRRRTSRPMRARRQSQGRLRRAGLPRAMGDGVPPTISSRTATRGNASRRRARRDRTRPSVRACGPLSTARAAWRPGVRGGPPRRRRSARSAARHQGPSGRRRARGLRCGSRSRGTRLPR
jgi:hypothetical protein